MARVMTRSAPVTSLLLLAGAAVLAVALTVCSGGQSAAAGPDLPKAARAAQFLPPAPEGDRWVLVWHDEFDGDTIDESQWEIIGDRRRRDGWWVKSDSYLDGQGRLVLRTRRQGDRFTSGAMRTQDKFAHRFGYWECRCKFPSEVGHWPAFWLFSRPGVTKVGDGGRDGTEIDIMEKPFRDARTNHALHWDGYGKHHRSAAKHFEFPGLMKGWHTFGLHWEPDEYVFYIDGKETWRTKAGGVSQVPAFVKLTEEIGPWAGDIKKATLPDHFLVDYVRVFDLKSRVK